MMAIQNNVFRILAIEVSDDQITARVNINTASEIFKGHFPGQPVVPGASMLQLVKDVVETALNGSYLLKRADNLKYLAMIDIHKNNLLELSINYAIESGQTVAATANLVADGVNFFKFQGVFVAEE